MNNYRNTYGYPQQNQPSRCMENKCKATTMLPENPVVAMAYVPYQECNDVYPCEKALCQGSVFPVLDKPLLVGCCR
ncbi:MAG: spore coat associated protein CotJA [Ruminococcus sp.]|nr:spore coat associated protein CotJA [Ruminococcus sp.]